MTRVRVDERQRLDLQPQPTPLASRLEPLWSWRYPTGRRRRQLHAWHDQLLYLDDDGVGSVEHGAAGNDGPQPPGTYQRIDVESLGGSLERGPIVMSRAGDVGRWDGGVVPMSLPHPQASSVAGWRGATLTGLDDGLVLARRFDPASTELIDVDGSEIAWHRDGCGLAVVPFDGRLVEMDRQDRTAVKSWDVASGELMWSMRAGGRVEHLITVVDDRVWLAMADDRMLALDLVSGEVQAARRIPGVRGMPGAVTTDGRYVLCSGYDVQIIDLADGETVAEHHFTGGEHVHAGAFVRVAADGRVAFPDQRCHIWVIEPDDPQRPWLLATADGLIMGFEINHQRLYVLTEHGTLAAYGTPSG